MRGLENISRGPRQDRATAGFTLVETIVAGVVAAILIAAVAGILAFTARSMGYQRAQDNAATVASTVRTALEGTLRTAEFSGSDVREGNAAGDASITFKTTQATQYLGNAGATYTLRVVDGRLCIAKGKASSADDDFKSLLPEKTYIDDTQIDWNLAKRGSGAVEIKIYAPASMAATAPDTPTAQTIIESVNGGASAS